MTTYRIHWTHSDKPNTYQFTVRVERDGVLVGCEGARCEDECGDALAAALVQARAGMKRVRRER